MDYVLIIRQLTIVFASIFVFMFMLPNIFTRGFFLAYFKVKTSMGKKVLIHIKESFDGRFVAGIIDDGFLICPIQKTKNNDGAFVKEIKYSIDSNKECIEYVLGVKVIHVDGTNILYYKNAEINSVSGYDLKRHSLLMKRAITSSKLKNDEEETRKWRLTWLMIGLCLVAIGIATYFIYSTFAPQLLQLHNEHLAILELLKINPNIVK